MTFDYDKFAEALSKANKADSKKEKPMFESARQLIEQGWFSKREYLIDDMMFQVLDKKGESIKNLKADLADYLDTIPKKLRSNMPARNEILDIVSYMRDEKRLQKWEEIAKFFYAGNCGKESMDMMLQSQAYNEIGKLVHILTPERNPEHEMGRPEYDDAPERMRYSFLFVNLFQQFKHMEIRKQVHPFPIMLIFFGAEGIGKTKFLEKLSSIFQPFVARASFQAITEPEKYYKILCDNRMTICEEMVGVQRSDNESFKATFTSSTLDVRTFHTQDIDKHRIRSVPIANTNKPIWEIMRAYGKNRRFGNIFVRNEIDFTKLAEIDFLKILQGIPLCESKEEVDKSILMYKSYCEPYQLETQNLDEFEQWVNARELKRHEDNSRNQFVPFEKFFEDWKEYWAAKGGFPKYYTERFLKNKIKTHFGIDCRPETDYTKEGKRGMKIDTTKHNFGYHTQVEQGTIVPLRNQSKVF